jgi:endonuclease G
VAWRLVPSDLGNQARSNSFAPDKNLPSTITIVQPKDYAKSGYDKGHMCPSADRTSTLPANTETFLMTNMQPQLHSLNAGPWKSLETYERGLAASGKQVEIVAGGVFTNSTATIGPGIAVPTANFKILVVQEPGQTASDVTTSTPVYAVIMPNKAESAGTKWTQFLVSVDEVERQTGYDFLSEIPDDVENVIEARVANAPE